MYVAYTRSRASKDGVRSGHSSSVATAPIAQIVSIHPLRVYIHAARSSPTQHTAHASNSSGGGGSAIAYERPFIKLIYCLVNWCRVELSSIVVIANTPAEGSLPREINDRRCCARVCVCVGGCISDAKRASSSVLWAGIDWESWRIYALVNSRVTTRGSFGCLSCGLPSAGVYTFRGVIWEGKEGEVKKLMFVGLWDRKCYCFGRGFAAGMGIDTFVDIACK